MDLPVGRKPSSMWLSAFEELHRLSALIGVSPWYGVGAANTTEDDPSQEDTSDNEKGPSNA